ncbi:hypothetical protein WDW89_17600 [Deltaproteobacteria bacterium TL4]
MKWLVPQSRFLIKTLFKRNYDTMSTQAQKVIETVVLGIDLASILLLLTLVVR